MSYSKRKAQEVGEWLKAREGRVSFEDFIKYLEDAFYDVELTSRGELIMAENPPGEYKRRINCHGPGGGIPCPNEAWWFYDRAGAPRLRCDPCGRAHTRMRKRKWKASTKEQEAA